MGLTGHVGAASVALNSGTTASGANLGCLTNEGFGLDDLVVVTGLVLVARLALVPWDLADHALLVVADLAAKDRHVFAANVDLTRLAFGRHLQKKNRVSRCLYSYEAQHFSNFSLASLKLLTQ